MAPPHSGFDNKHLNQLYPTFNINGIQAGGVNDERRTIIPSTAIASIDCRLVPNMDSQLISDLISDHITQWSQSKGIEDAVHLEFEHAMEPIGTSITSPFISTVFQAAKEGFGVDPIIVPRLGGSLPTYVFPKYLNRQVILVPYALPDERNHAPNENLDIPFFIGGVTTTINLLLQLANQS